MSALLQAASAGDTALGPACAVEAAAATPAAASILTKIVEVRRIMGVLQKFVATSVKLLAPPCANKRDVSWQASVFLTRAARLDQPRAQSANVVTVFIFRANEERVVLLCNQLFIEHAYQAALRELASRELRGQQ